jgi:uncharacterized surface protein with fasciclin (FAS1) repeats
MIGHRSLDEVRRFDLFKLAVALFLILLILLSLLRAGLGTSAVTDSTTEGAIPLATAEIAGGGLATSPVVGSPANGAEIAQSGMTTVSGTAPAGAVVQVLIDGAPAGQTTADAAGLWSLPLALPLGPVTISAQALDPAGAVIGQSAPVGVTVRPPLPPAVNPGSSAAGADGLVVLSGTAEPGAGVTIVIDGQPAGTTTAAPDGTWSLAVPLAVGPHTVVARSSLDGGATVQESAPVTYEVTNPLSLNAADGFVFDPLTGEYVVSGTAIPGDTVQLVIDGVVAGATTADEAGNWSLSVAVPAGETQVSVQTVNPDTGEVQSTLEPITVDVPTEPPSIDMPGLALPDPATGEEQLAIPAGPFTLQGEGAPGTQVAVTINGQPAGTTVVNDAGQWSLDVDLPPGTYEMQLALLDVNGTPLSGTQPFMFVVVEGQRPSVNQPPTGLAAGPNTLTGTAAPGATVVVYVNGQPVGQTTAGPDGAWSLDVALADGPNEISVQTLDAGGAPQLGSTPVVVPINITIPALAASTGEFDTLVAAIEASGLAGTLNGTGPYTVFAPTDDAFAALPEGALDALLANPEALSTLLQGHVVPGQLLDVDVAAADALTTINGGTLAVSVDNGQVFVANGAISQANVLASNGVIHVVDQVLFPTAAGMQPPIIDESGVPTFTGPILTVVGTAEPGKRILLRVNGEAFGDVATVDAGGNWLVVDDITAGQYVIVAYMLESDGTLLGISKPVNLLVP